jgi:hypothetical protein
VLNLVSESRSFLLDGSDVRLEFTSDAFEFADDGLFDSLGEILVLVGEETVVVANLVKDFLPSSFSEETVTLVEGNLDGFVESESRFAGSVLNVSETLLNEKTVSFQIKRVVGW